MRKKYGEDRFFGHLAYEVNDIYAVCERLMKLGIPHQPPPRDGQMAFVPLAGPAFDRTAASGRCQAAAEPWARMPNTGHW